MHTTIIMLLNNYYYYYYYYHAEEFAQYQGICGFYIISFMPSGGLCPLGALK